MTGSLWGRPVWGVWWTWDARLTSTALLLLLEIGYLALRRVPAEPAVRARRCAVAALLIAIDVPIVHFSVDWWNTLHQGGTFLDPGFKIHASASMSWTFLLGFVAFSLLFAWLLGVRYQVEVLEDAVGEEELEVSLAERWSEGDTALGVGAGARRPRHRSATEARREVRRRRLRHRARHLVRLRHLARGTPAALGARAEGVGSAGHRQCPPAGARRALVSGTTTESSPPPITPTSEARSGPAVPPPRRRRTSRRVLVVFALLVVALVFLLVEGLGSSLDYFDTVDQALAHRATLGTRTFRLEGNVVPGSIHATTTGTDFNLSEGGHVVQVANTGSPPQLFQANIPVVVVGHFTSETAPDFVSNTIMVKHSSTYIAQYPGRVRAKNGTVH